MNRPSDFSLRSSALSLRVLSIAAFVLAGPCGGPNFSSAFAQQPAPQPPPVTTAAAPASVAAAAETPPGYVIGPDDVLSIVVWREKDLSTEVVVRPDGRITLPLANDIAAQGLTPEALRARITDAVGKFVEEPSVTVVVKQINSRKVFLVGMVAKQGAFPLTSPTTVLQLISLAGGLSEFAQHKDIVINRTENGRQVALKFNYSDVRKGKNLKQNIELKPGDTVIVP